MPTSRVTERLGGNLNRSEASSVLPHGVKEEVNWNSPKGSGGHPGKELAFSFSWPHGFLVPHTDPTLLLTGKPGNAGTSEEYVLG